MIQFASYVSCGLFSHIKGPNVFKNPVRQEVDQLAILFTSMTYELNLGLPKNFTSWWSEQDLNPFMYTYKGDIP